MAYGATREKFGLSYDSNSLNKRGVDLTHSPAIATTWRATVRRRSSRPWTRPSHQNEITSLPHPTVRNRIRASRSARIHEPTRERTAEDFQFARGAMGYSYNKGRAEANMNTLANALEPRHMPG